MLSTNASHLQVYPNSQMSHQLIKDYRECILCLWFSVQTSRSLWQCHAGCSCMQNFRCYHNLEVDSFPVHRITERLKLEGTSRSRMVQVPCLSRVTYSRLTQGPYSGSFWISPRIKTPQSLQATSASAPSPSLLYLFKHLQLCFSLCSLPLVMAVGTTENRLAPFSLHSPFRVFYFYTFQFQYIDEIPPWAFFFLGWTVPSDSLLSHKRDASVPSSSSWSFIGLFSAHPCHPCKNSLELLLSCQQWCSTLLLRRKNLIRAL